MHQHHMEVFGWIVFTAALASAFATLALDGPAWVSNCLIGLAFMAALPVMLSLAESDVTLDAAIAAATEWASEHGVPRIWVQTTPD